jgi:hypothetical protein
MTRDDLIREIDNLSRKIALNSTYGLMGLANSIVGVQPMTGPVGEIFTMKASYKPQSKYKFSRNWYIADISEADYHNVRAWCTEHFGPEDKFPNSWSRWQHRYEHQIFLRDEQDYILFVLKWGA